MNESELWSAAKRGDIELLRRAISTEELTAIVDLRNPDGDSLAHIAARKGHIQFLQLLHNSGFDLESPNKRGKTLIHEATQNSQLQILKYLKSQGADFHAITKDGTLYFTDPSFPVDLGDSCLDLAKKPEITTYLESVIYSDQPVVKKKPKSKTRRHQSELQEVGKSGGVVPNSDPISRTTDFHQIMDSEFPLCNLEHVGWKTENLELLGFPKRPDWRTLGLFTAEALHSYEEQSFNNWIQNLDAFGKPISTFERNLEYWRQLWRVLERGEICLIIVDGRNPLLHLNHSFLSYLSTELAMKSIICLNKADLVEVELLEAWKEYLTHRFGVEVVFCSCKDNGESRSRLLDCILCQEASSGASIQDTILKDSKGVLEYRQGLNQKSKKTRRIKPRLDESSCSSSEGEQEEEGKLQKPIVVSIVGEPNVGKSSVVNYLLGVKKVGVSSHPGRTKHLQTHLLCPGLMLCDCPGIVFPKIDVPFSMQVLFGCFPIARCRDVYSVVEFLARYISPPLPELLGLESGASTDCSWSVLEICEELANKHHWMTHKGGRLDIYRAANTILRNALAGREEIVLKYWPPNKFESSIDSNSSY